MSAGAAARCLAWLADGSLLARAWLAASWPWLGLVGRRLAMPMPNHHIECNM